MGKRQVGCGIPGLVAMLFSVQGLSIVFGSHSFAQEDSCKSELSRISEDIEARLGGKIAYVYYEGGKAEGSPTSRKDRVNFQLGVKREGPQLTNQQNRANSNILASTGLMRAYAESVIRNCADVAQVEIGLMWSDAGSIFSLHSDEQIREDECLPTAEHPNLDSKYLRWGARLCS